MSDRVLLDADDDGRTNAYIGDQFGLEAWNMMEGYAEGAKILIDLELSTRQDRDTLIWPVLFLIRHYIELSTKTIYRKLKLVHENVQIEKDSITHHLVSEEFSYIKKNSKQYGAKMPEEIVQFAQKIDSFDNSGYYPKYSYDTKGNKLRTGENKLTGYQYLGEIREKAHEFFSGLYATLEHIIEMQEENRNNNCE